MKFLLIAALALLVVSQLAAAACHNYTGTCTETAYVCANEEAIPHHKRCDGVEDCADGTDEYMCDQSPKPHTELTPAERNAITEVACVKCTCIKGSITVTAAAWLKIAFASPRDSQMMTDSPGSQNKACNPFTTTSVTLNVYKKKNKGCRGWVCCFRQQSCNTCSTGTTANHCY